MDVQDVFQILFCLREYEESILKTGLLLESKQVVGCVVDVSRFNKLDQVRVDILTVEFYADEASREILSRFLTIDTDSCTAIISMPVLGAKELVRL